MTEEKLLQTFDNAVSRHKYLIKKIREERSKIKRVFLNLKAYGFRYILFICVRFNIPFPKKQFTARLFLGKKMIWPITDISAHMLSLYTIMSDSSERKLTRFLLKNLKDDDVLYDVGAHLGFYAALSEHILKNGEVHAFEANKKLCAYLEKNFKNNNSVHISCNAVSNEVGEIDFFDATEEQDSSVSSRHNISDLNITPTKVSAISLDSYVDRGNRPPTIIKFDIEGGEHEAIIGAASVLKKYKPQIIIEIWGGKEGDMYSQKAVKKLKEFGYVAHKLTEDGFYEEKSTEDPVQALGNKAHARDNYLFLAR